MISVHARKRMRQRAVSDAAIEILFDLGQAEPSINGSEIIYFDRRGKKAALAEFRDAGISDHCLNAYVILGRFGTVVTVGHRTQPIKHR